MLYLDEDTLQIRSSEATVNAGSVSDGYHTFDELYAHRIANYKALCKQLTLDRESTHDIWKSRTHSDGSSYEGWFILGIDKEPGTQSTYHLPLSEWDNCTFASTLEIAPEYDGHTAADVLVRLENLL